MPYLDSALPLWTFGLIQVIGLASALLARMSEGSRSQSPCQWLFLACLALVGFTTMVSMIMGPHSWQVSCATLTAMVLGATWDLRAEPSTGSL